MLYASLVVVTSSPKYEIIRLRREGEYYDVQIAIAGVLSPAMEIHVSCREQYTREEDFISYLVRSAQTMIDLYGDARHPLPATAPEMEMSMTA